LAPDSRAKAFLNSASNLPRYDRFSNAKIVHAVSMTPHAQKYYFTVAPLNLPIFLVVGYRGRQSRENSVSLLQESIWGCLGKQCPTSVSFFWGGEVGQGVALT
jgi:hypothetical protein